MTGIASARDDGSSSSDFDLEPSSSYPAEANDDVVQAEDHMISSARDQGLEDGEFEPILSEKSISDSDMPDEEAQDADATHPIAGEPKHKIIDLKFDRSQLAAPPMPRVLPSFHNQLDIPSQHCPKCSKAFSTKSGIKLHLSTNCPSRTSTASSASHANSPGVEMGTMLNDGSDANSDEPLDESGDNPRARKKYERKKEEPLSCPTCGETMSQASLLAAHLAHFPFDHGPTDNYRDIQFSLDDDGWMERFQNPEPVLSNVAHHSTTVAARAYITSQHQVRGAPGTDCEEIIGAMALPDAPPSVYTLCTPASHVVLPRLSFFPIGAEPAEELCTVNFDLNTFVEPERHSNSHAPSEHTGGTTQSRGNSPSDSCTSASEAYRMYFCGAQLTTFGPIFRTNMTAMILFAKDSQFRTFSERFQERIAPLDIENNSILYRRKSDKQWLMATDFVGLENSKTGARPLRLVVAVAGDVDLSEVGYSFSKTFRAQPVGNDGVCPICDSVKTNLTQHIRRVHEELRYQCKECSKDFRDMHSYVSHYHEVHRGIRYQCDVCSALFTRRTNLLHHVRRVHLGKRIKCPDCDLECSSMRTFKVHRHRVHLAPRPRFSCALCANDFESDERLRAHIASQHDNVVYPCGHCHRKFAFRRFLAAHHATEHHGNVVKAAELEG